MNIDNKAQLDLYDGECCCPLPDCDLTTLTKVGFRHWKLSTFVNEQDVMDPFYSLWWGKDALDDDVLCGRYLQVVDTFVWGLNEPMPGPGDYGEGTWDRREFSGTAVLTRTADEPVLRDTFGANVGFSSSGTVTIKRQRYYEVSVGSGPWYLARDYVLVATPDLLGEKWDVQIDYVTYDSVGTEIGRTTLNYSGQVPDPATIFSLSPTAICGSSSFVRNLITNGTDSAEFNWTWRGLDACTQTVEATLPFTEIPFEEAVQDWWDDVATWLSGDPDRRPPDHESLVVNPHGGLAFDVVAQRAYAYRDEPCEYLNGDGSANLREVRFYYAWKVPYPWERGLNEATAGTKLSKWHEVEWGLLFTPRAYSKWQAEHAQWEEDRDAWVAEDPENRAPEDYPEEEPTQPEGSAPTLLTNEDSPWEWTFPTGDWATWASVYEEWLGDIADWEADDPETRGDPPAEPTLPSGPDPWYSDWWTVKVPKTTVEDAPSEGDVTIVNKRERCYKGAPYGSKAQEDESFDNYVEP